MTKYDSNQIAEIKKCIRDVKELKAFRKMKSEEAEKCGLVSRLYENKEEMMKSALELAENIASKSPVAVQGTKVHLNYSREHSVQEGLRNMVTWNMAMLQSEDVMKSAMASMNKDGPPEFEKF